MLGKDMKKYSYQQNIGLDLACSNMGNRELFLTKEYIGLDIDKKSLNEGKKKYPEAKTIVSSIEDIKNIKADIVLCVQTININTLFETKNTLIAINSMLKTVKKGGSLIFNIGDYNDGLIYEKEVDKLLKEQFKVIKKVKYGTFYYYETNYLLSLVLGYLLWYIPSLRTKKGHKMTYYRCLHKK